MDDSSGLILKAMQFAAEKHKNQRRKDRNRTPYINHPVSVASILYFQAGIRDADTISAALLHDVLEDTDTSFEEMKFHFPGKIPLLVSEVTDDKKLPRHVRKIRQIENAPALSHEARLIRIADKINNLRDITYSPPVFWSRKELRAYQDWASSVVNKIRGTHPVLEEIFDETLKLAREKTE